MPEKPTDVQKEFKYALEFLKLAAVTTYEPSTSPAPPRTTQHLPKPLPDYYAILNIEAYKNHSKEEIATAYSRLLLTLTICRTLIEEDSDQKTLAATQEELTSIESIAKLAQAILTDPYRKQLYDEQRKSVLTESRNVLKAQYEAQKKEAAFERGKALAMKKLEEAIKNNRYLQSDEAKQVANKVLGGLRNLTTKKKTFIDLYTCSQREFSDEELKKQLHLGIYLSRIISPEGFIITATTEHKTRNYYNAANRSTCYEELKWGYRIGLKMRDEKPNNQYL